MSDGVGMIYTCCGMSLGTPHADWCPVIKAALAKECPECGCPAGSHFSRCSKHERHAAKVTPIRPDIGDPGVTEALAHVPTMLRRLADEIEADQRATVDLCLVVISTVSAPEVPPFRVHSFGRRPGTFEAKGLLVAAAERVPVR